MRQTLRKEVVDPRRSLADERRDWDDHGRSLPLAAGVNTAQEDLAGVACLWLEPAVRSDEGVILYAHGGGLVAGSIVTHRALASRLAAGTGRRVVLADYRLVPENPFTAPRDDLIGVFRALVNARGLRPAQIAFGGDSSGAAAAIAGMAWLRDRGLAQPACAFAVSGAFDVSLSGDSVGTRDAVDPVLSEAVLRDWQKYFLGSIRLDAPEISPLFADLAGLPPVFLLAGDHEVWLSDSIRMAAELQASGGDATVKVFDEMWHVWLNHPELPESAEAMADIRSFVDLHLG